MTTDIDLSLESELPSLRATVRRIAGAQHADDLVQECCVRILASAPALDMGPKGSGAWMRTIARNMSISFLRKRALRESTSPDIEVEAPTSLSEEEEKIGWILDQLSRLSQADRDVIRLRFFDGKTVEATGRELGISQASASRRLAKAIGRLEGSARRQGWLASFLPLPFAKFIAGVSPMKSAAVAAVTVATAGAIAGSAFYLPDESAHLVGNTAALEGTTFAESFEHPMQNGTNVLWCGTLKLAWDAAIAGAGPRFDFGAAAPSVQAIVRDPFTERDLSAGSYVVGSGFAGDNWVEETQQRLIQTFGRGRDPILDGLAGSNAFAYAFLAKAIGFDPSFDAFPEEPILFGPNDVPVACWGAADIDPNDSTNEQVELIRYGGPDDFILQFSGPAGDRLIVAKVAPAATIGETWAAVDTRRQALTQMTEQERSQLKWTRGDSFRMPRIDFDLTHVFPPAGPTGLPGAESLTTVQSIRFAVSERGAELRSRATMLRSIAEEREPLSLIVDSAFLVAMIEEQADTPYFLGWFETAELLVDAKGNDERERADEER